MSDFNEWYAKINPNLNSWDDDFFEEVRKAYEAGAASQAGTLRDEFAGRVITGISATEGDMQWMTQHGAKYAYQIADAMLEARKTTGEGEA
jgi:hypothetical protein